MKNFNTSSPTLLEKYYLGECSPDEAFDVEKWLASADKHEESADMLTTIFDRIDASNDSMAEKAFSKCADTLNIARNPQKNRVPSYLLFSLLAVAASFVIGLLVYGKRTVAQPSLPIEFIDVYAQRGASQKVTLPDGSVIILKSGSHLIYPSEFSGKTRKVYLSGECYASIQKNPDCPFVMSTGLMNVRVTGTEFNIKSFPEDSEAEVALVNGSVQLESRTESPIPLKSISLAPGNVVKVDRKNGETQISRFDTNSYDESKGDSQTFVFLDRRFCDIVSELSRNLDVNIVLEDKTLGDKRFYSSFINGEDLMEMLGTFNTDGSMHITREGDTIRISKVAI